MAIHFLVLLPLLLLASSSSLPAAVSSSSNSITTTTNTSSSTTAAAKQYLNYSFSSFDFSFRNVNLTVRGDAGINQGALQITPDTLNDASFLTHKSGRVLYSTPFKLWHYSSSNATISDKYVASFHTVFTINVFRPPNTIPAEGCAFIIAPSLDAPPPGSDGGYLGLTNASSDGNATNQLVAIELDTEKQPYDQDDNHVGLNINSVISVANASLTPFGTEIAPINATKYNVWVDYDGASRHISVYMAVTGQAKPTSPVLSAPLDLGDIVAEQSYFGFSASTGSKYQLNCVLAWNMTVEKLPADDQDIGVILPKWKVGLAVGVSAGALVVMAAIALMVYMYVVMRRKKVQIGEEAGSGIITGTLIRSLAGGPREFDYKELRKATNNFDEKMKLGQGGYGVVYRGAVPLPGDAESTVEVAVKKFSRANTQGQNDFLAELSIINRLRHKHLVRLVGWSHNNGELLLVYEFMPNGSLDQHLFSSGPGRQLLSWECRYKIISGVASALHYLHDEYDQKVVHRDLKASNIMLDSAFNARLGDFGLARAIETDKTSYVEELGGVPGTVGYIAPECFHTGKATRESDVYALGAVILEVVCGRRPRCDIDGFQFLVDWVWRLHRDGRVLEAVDPRLDGFFAEDDAERLLLLGLACSHPIPAERPKTLVISQILLRSMPPPEVPPFKPAFVWPAAGAGYDTMTTTAGTSSQLDSTIMTSSSAWSHNYMSKESYDVSEQDTSMV